MHAGQERVLLPPGPQLAGDPLGVLLVLAQVPGGGQQGQVLQPGDLPDLLDVADLFLGPVVDAEGVPVGFGAAPGHRVQEPVRLDQVGPQHAEDLASKEGSLSSVSETGDFGQLAMDLINIDGIDKSTVNADLATVTDDCK